MANKELSAEKPWVSEGSQGSPFVLGEAEGYHTLEEGLLLPLSALGNRATLSCIEGPEAAPPWLPLHSQDPAGGSQEPARRSRGTRTPPGPYATVSSLSGGLPGPVDRCLVNYLYFPVGEITTELPSLNWFVIDPEGNYRPRSSLRLLDPPPPAWDPPTSHRVFPVLVHPVLCVPVPPLNHCYGSWQCHW